MEAQLKNIDYNEIVYHYEEKIEKEKQNILNKVANKELSKRNADFILEFIRDRKLKKGFSNSRICKLLNKLKLIALVIKKDFDKWDKPEAETFLEYISNRNDIAKATKVDYLIILKIFFKWLKGNDKVVPEFLADIKATQERKRRLPSEILTEEDLLKMINATSHPRNKALISLICRHSLKCEPPAINVKLKKV